MPRPDQMQAQSPQSEMMLGAAPDLWGDRTFVPPATYDALVALLGRLEIIIDSETALLRQHQHASLPETTWQKRQGLLELDRLMRVMADAVPSQDLLARLADFRARLARNDAALSVELRAAQTINAILVRTLREVESDGTYSRCHGRSTGPAGGYGWE